jgi:hypothetical protein
MNRLKKAVDKVAEGCFWVFFYFFMALVNWVRRSIVNWPRRVLVVILWGCIWSTLYLLTRNAPATTIMVLGMALSLRLWPPFCRHFYIYRDPDPASPVAPPASRVWTLIWAVVLLAMACVLTFALVDTAFRGVDDSRMIWAYHEDEGWLSDLYQEYINQRRFEIGKEWGFTYGSFHLMATSLISRLLTLYFTTPITATDAIILNRLLLIGALLATGGLLFIAGRRFLNSPFAGTAAAMLLWTNVKVLEMTVLSNYPDIIAMFVLGVAFCTVCAVTIRPTARSLFLAPLLIGIGFSIKFMGLPLALIQIVAFRIAQGRLHKRDPLVSTGRLRKDLLLYIAYVPLAIGAAFFTINPFYLIHFKRFISQMSVLSNLYAGANINNLPASAIHLPSLGDWWHVATAGGEPDPLLFGGVAILGVSSFLTLWWRRPVSSCPSPMLVFYVTSFVFILLWTLFVLHFSNFAFFHYFLPILPWIYLLAGILPILLLRLIRRWWPNSRYGPLVALVVGIGAVGLFVVPVWRDLRYPDEGGAIYIANSLGYANHDSAVSSRFLSTYGILTSVRKGGEALVIGEWLNSHATEARSAISTDTIFYFPPFIRDLRYLNRQMTLDILLRSMPDLLVVSDYFIDMYTRAYPETEIAAMGAVERDAFLKAREFYRLIKGQDEVLNYRKLKEFSAPIGKYWKRLHIYRRQGPRIMGALATGFTTPALSPPPNGTEIFFREEVILPEEVYLAALEGQPLPTTLGIQLKSPHRISGIGFLWYDDKNLPKSARIAGYRGERQIFARPIAIQFTGSGTPYSWEPVSTPEPVDRLVLTVQEFTGQQRLLLRGMFVKAEGIK